ncbi:non-ribosomal peptide synthetase, partial [Flavobacterium oreochromis]
YDLFLIERMFAHLESLLTQAIENDTHLIESIDFLSNQERHQLLYDFNDTKIDYPKDKTIVELLEEQVAKTPDTIAVVFDNVELTYQELNEQANQLGAYLRENYQIQPDDLIAIKLERSEKMIVVILGILKSGAAYVPIDPAYPQDRIDYIEQDTQAKVTINEDFLTEYNNVKNNYDNSNLEIISKPDNLAYIIYTSGTTGQPKGVMIENKGVINLIQSQTEQFQIEKDEKILLFSNYSFDASVEQIFLTILNGCSLFILSKETLLDETLLENFIYKNEITHLHAVPSLLNKIRPDNRFSLERVIAGGDICSIELAKSWSSICDFYNEYGPTETTVTSVEFCYKQNEILSIGRPISNTQVYILNQDKKVVPIGVTGKLYISGAGLSRGYLNKPELTAEKFIVNPFEAGTKMYDTGDLARWLPDGNIEFLGRADFQVKIRGYRIELGEIETSLSQFSEDITQVVVEVKEINSEKVLVAYYTTREDKEIDKTLLREYLQSKLPEYMVPSYFVELETIPLTPNGKIDRKGLPSVSGEDLIRREYIAPRNETEKQLVTIWQEVLGVENIGITDSFFELGGNSLKIISVINKIEEKWSVEVKIKDFFKFSTPLALAGFIEQNNDVAGIVHEKIEPLVKQEFYPITATQFGIWFECQKSNDLLKSYNMVHGLLIHGVLDKKLVENSIHMLVKRHEILRTVFTIEETGVMQKVIDIVDLNFYFEVEEVSLNENEITTYGDCLLKKEKERIFDLENGPLIYFKYVIVNNKSFFIFNIHHIVCDGSSIKVIIDDFFDYYENLQTNIDYKKESLYIQYKEYASWLNAKTEINESIYKDYWVNQLLPLPKPSFIINQNQNSYKGKKISVNSSPELVDRVRSFILKNNSTDYILYSSIAALLIYEWTGNNKVVLLSPFSVRPNIVFENQIGLYLNTVPLCMNVGENKSFIEIIDQTKDTVLKNFSNYYYPFASIVDALMEQGAVIENIFNVMFTLQNQDTGEENLNKSIKFNKTSLILSSNSLSKLNLTFSLAVSNLLHLEIEYNENLFNDQEVASFALRYLELIDQNIK